MFVLSYKPTRSKVLKSGRVVQVEYEDEYASFPAAWRRRFEKEVEKEINNLIAINNGDLHETLFQIRDSVNRVMGLVSIENSRKRAEEYIPPHSGDDEPFCEFDSYYSGDDEPLCEKTGLRANCYDNIKSFEDALNMSYCESCFERLPKEARR